MIEKINTYLPPDFPWQDNILWFDTIDSTNTHAKVLAANGAPHGTTLIADSQTGGRGRMGRSFLSPGGRGIYLSVILRPNCLPGDLMHLTCAAAVAVCDAVEAAAGFRPGIKWTNDLVSGRKKLGGILTELSLDAKSGLVQYAIVGIGINCSQTEAGFAPEIQDMAASVSMITGRKISRSQLAAAMITSLKDMDCKLLNQKAAIMDAYRADCITIGKEISLHRGDELRHGTAIGVDDDGALLVRFQDGHTEAVNSGEVSVRGMYGYV